MRPGPASALLVTLLACGPATTPTSPGSPPGAEPGPHGGGCDQAALRAAADATSAMLAAWRPDRGELPDYRLAVRGLRAACSGLPPGFHAFLEYGVHPVPDIRSDQMQLGTPLRGDPEGLRPLVRRCPGYQQILDDVATRPADERIPTIFEGCKFAELGVFTLAELASNFGDAGGFHGHALYLWLVDDGAPPAVARELVRPIVAGADYTLEVGTTRAKLPTVARAPAAGWLTPTLHVSLEAVTFDEQRLVPLAQGRLAASESGQMLVGPVFDEFAEELDKSNALAEQSGRPQSFALSIAADPTLPWATMGKLVWTAARAGVRSLDVYALVPDPMRPVAKLPLLAVGPAPTIELEIRPDRVALRCGGETATHDAAALVGALGGCGGGSLRLAAADDTTWQRVVEVLAVLAGHAAITELELRGENPSVGHVSKPTPPPEAPEADLLLPPPT